MIPSLSAGAVANASGMHAVKALASIKGQCCETCITFSCFLRLKKMGSAEMVFWQCMQLYPEIFTSSCAEVANEFFPLIWKRKKIKSQPKYANADSLAIGEMNDGLG